MLKLLRRCVLFLFAWLPFPVLAQQPTTFEILSKDDAKATFAMSQQQWNENLRQLVAAGAAVHTGTESSGFGMATNTPEGYILMVKPDYSRGPRRPAFVQVTVGYRPPVPSFLTDQHLSSLIADAKTQLAPEFFVIGNFERIQGGLAVFFTISEATP